MSRLQVIFVATLATSLFFSGISQSKEFPAIKSAIDSKDYKLSVQLLSKALKESPSDSELYYLLAQSQMNTDKLDKAEDSIEKAIELNSTSEKIYLLASGIYGSQAQASSIFSKLGYAKKARKSLDKVLTINPENSDALSGLIQFHLAAPGIAGGDKDEIPELLSKLTLVDSTMGTILKAQLLFNNKESKKAYAALNQGIRDNPKSIGIRFVKGMRLQTDNKLKDSFSELHKTGQLALTEKSSEQEREWHALALYQSAKVSAESGIELEQGKKNMYAFMDLDQTTVSQAWIRFRLGQILWQLGEEDYAKAQFEQINTLSPDKRLTKLKKEYLKSIKHKEL